MCVNVMKCALNGGGGMVWVWFTAFNEQSLLKSSPSDSPLVIAQTQLLFSYLSPTNNSDKMRPKLGFIRYIVLCKIIDTTHHHSIRRTEKPFRSISNPDIL